MRKNKIIVYCCSVLCLLALAAFVMQPVLGAIKKKDRKTQIAAMPKVEVQFDADSAYAFCAKQCEFGPRVMNSEAHTKCGEWIKAQFTLYGCEVETQKGDLKGFDGTMLKSENIIARLNPEVKERILICAHWDARPWADNDPDEANHDKPVMAANDGASGVAVMIEMARVLSTDSTKVGIDFVCFDAEDWGTENDADSWALGAQHWSREWGSNPELTYKYGVLLDMVGGEGARFYKEQFSMRYAPDVVDRLWSAAETAGYASLFPKEVGGAITDDHVPVNDIAMIPCIDVIPYYPTCEQSSFGPTWHTVSDTMEHISKTTLKAVGQTMLQMVLQ